MRRVFALIALVGASIALLPSCGSTPACASWTSPCAQWFDVVAYCNESDGCLLDGQPANCGGGGCVLELGKSFEVPISAFANELDGRHDLRVSTLASPTDVWPSASATLNGVPGASPRWDDDFPDIAGFRWEPFPSSPGKLVLTYDNMPAGSHSTFALAFVDGACEAANPPPDCPL